MINGNDNHASSINRCCYCEARMVRIDLDGRLGICHNCKNQCLFIDQAHLNNWKEQQAKTNAAGKQK